VSVVPSGCVTVMGIRNAGAALTRMATIPIAISVISFFILFSFFGYKVTENREQYKTNSFVFIAEME